jgi:hypothetical protein
MAVEPIRWKQGHSGAHLARGMKSARRDCARPRPSAPGCHIGGHQRRPSEAGQAAPGLIQSPTGASRLLCYDLRPLAGRRERGFRFGFCPVAALMVSEMTARCWRLIAAVAAPVHAPAARLAMLRKMLRGDPFISGLLSAVNGCQDEAFRRTIDALGNDEGRSVAAQASALNAASALRRARS